MIHFVDKLPYHFLHPVLNSSSLTYIHTTIFWQTH